MSVDIQCVFPQEVIKVSRVRNVPGLPVRTLDVVGEDFRAVDEVLLNNIAAPSFVVVSGTRLLVEVPGSLASATITSVMVLSKRLTLSSKSIMRFSLGHSVGKLQGIFRLMQLFLKVLMTTPGTDIFSPGSGGGALSRIGQSIGAEDGSDIVSDLVISVDRTTRQIIQIQSRNQSIPAGERLLSAKVLSCGFNKNETAQTASIELVSQAGKSALAQLEL
jgi:hypothetical protein